MIFKKYPSVSPVNELVAYYWTLEASESEEGGQFRFVPDGFVDWVFHIGKPWSYRFDGIDQEKSYRTHILGHIKTYLDLNVPGAGFSLFGIKFYPWAARQIWQIGMHESTCAYIELSDIGLKEIAEFETRVLAADTARVRIGIADNFLLEKMGKVEVNNLKSVCTQLIHSDKKIIEENFPLSKRRIEQKFREEIGISPKLFQRTFRINRLIKHLLANPDVDLTSIAYQFNYADQSHFIHDFRKFTGYSPGSFLKNINPDGDIFNLRVVG
ncbi:MAG: DUF6597 domain-containing transcriptional factor [Bacteroidota bacterium]